MSSLFISCHSLSLFRGSHCCFTEANLSIHAGCRMAVVGPNGSGKSSLLSALAQELPVSAGEMIRAPSLRVGYMNQSPHWVDGTTVREALLSPFVCQLEELVKLEQLGEMLGEDPAIDTQYSLLIESLEQADAFTLNARIDEIMERMQLTSLQDQLVVTLSGGECMRLALAELLLQQPDLLLLDEPTNHLDIQMRHWFLEFLSHTKCAVIISTHDRDLLTGWATEICEIEGGDLTVYQGGYANYLQEKSIAGEQESQAFVSLLKERKVLGATIQQEKTRRSRTMQQGKKKFANDKLARKSCAERAENTMGRIDKRRVEQRRGEVVDEIRNRRKTREPTPRFHFGNGSSYKALSISIRNGKIGYGKKVITEGISFTADAGDRIAIVGKNGSGKTCLLKALLNDPEVAKSGEWDISTNSEQDVGYLDQHYSLLTKEHSAVESIANIRPEWAEEQIRSHLDAFVFNDHRLQDRSSCTLSEGQKARLCLAILAARAPKLLLLDEVTNNLDIQTKEHLVRVLREYPGTLIVISHEESFLEQIGVVSRVQVG